MIMQKSILLFLSSNIKSRCLTYKQTNQKYKVIKQMKASEWFLEIANHMNDERSELYINQISSMQSFEIASPKQNEDYFQKAFIESSMEQEKNESWHRALVEKNNSLESQMERNQQRGMLPLQPQLSPQIDQLYDEIPFSNNRIDRSVLSDNSIQQQQFDSIAGGSIGLSSEQFDEIYNFDYQDWIEQIDDQDRRVSEEKIATLEIIDIVEECSICLSGTDHDQAQKGLKLQCQHQFHETCILQWFSAMNTCPLCRKIV